MNPRARAVFAGMRRVGSQDDGRSFDFAQDDREKKADTLSVMTALEGKRASPSEVLRWCHTPLRMTENAPLHATEKRGNFLACMFALPTSLRNALALSLLALVSCRSVLNLPPAQDIHGGLTVAVGLPGQPSATQVFADAGAFARRRGFVRQGEPPAAQMDPATHQPLPPSQERYLAGKMALDVTYDPAHLRVVADLHSPGALHDRQFMKTFTRDFRQQYGASYGDEGGIVENN